MNLFCCVTCVSLGEPLKHLPVCGMQILGVATYFANVAVFTQVILLVPDQLLSPPLALPFPPLSLTSHLYCTVSPFFVISCCLGNVLTFGHIACPWTAGTLLLSPLSPLFRYLILGFVFGVSSLAPLVEQEFIKPFCLAYAEAIPFFSLRCISMHVQVRGEELFP